jgi:hypothetical protein
MEEVLRYRQYLELLVYEMMITLSNALYKEMPTTSKVKDLKR